MLIGTLFKI